MKSLFYGMVLGLCAVALVGWLLIQWFPASVPSSPEPQVVESAPAPVKRVPVTVKTRPESVAVLERPVVAVGRPATGVVHRAVEKAGPERPAGRMDRDAIAGEQVMTFYSVAERDAFLAAARRHGVEVLGLMDFRNAVRVRVPNARALAEVLAESPSPVGTGVNHRVYSPPAAEPATPADAANLRGFGPYALRWLGVEGDNSAWGRGVKVAVLDTPVDKHAAIPEGQVVRLSEGDPLQEPGAFSHGSAVASLIVGTAEEGPFGVAPGATILGVPVLSRAGEGNAFDLARGIVDAVEAGARVISLSLGGMGDDVLLRDAVAYAIEKGVVLVAATGNEGAGEIYYPARYPGVVAVSAVDASGQHLPFANRGAEVDVAAPGLSVRAAGPGDGLAMFSGTSAAVPFVSGAAALLLSQQGDLKPADVERLLNQYADDVWLPGRDVSTGSGVLDLGRLLERGRAGIYDAAVGEPVLRKVGDRMAMAVSAQNRGTEVLRRLRLMVNLDGAPLEYVFYDVAVGQTVSQVIPMGVGKLEAGGVVAISCVVAIDGQVDAKPSNDRSVVEVRLDGR